MFIVTISKMDNSDAKSREFQSHQAAYSYFSSWCDEKGYQYDEQAGEAGGIGHDYRIAITESK